MNTHQQESVPSVIDQINYIPIFNGSGPQFYTDNVSQKVKNECKSFILDNDQLKKLMVDMDKAIRNGLGKETHQSSDVKCYITHMQDFPSGDEKGKYLALDLGGTNFRIILITLNEEHGVKNDSKIYKVPVNIQTGSGTALFDHIAECLAHFIELHELYNEKPLPLGFTFSFPLRQVGIAKGFLTSWTKGFTCSGVVNEDVVRLLREAIARRKDINIDVCGILNDTTGTLMTCMWDTPNTKIGLIVGTGCNACYIEKVENVELFDGDKFKEHMVINTEWGAFGEEGQLDEVCTKYDNIIDIESLNPGQQRFEKMISGMYLGEIVRLAIVDMISNNILFNGKISTKIKTKNAFSTSFISDIESANDNTKVLKILNELGIENPSNTDCENIRYICECVSKRSAHLVSVGLAVLLNKLSENFITIGVDGSVYRLHPFFKKYLEEKTRELTNENIEFKVKLSQDGSGGGAALVAAVVVNNQQQPQ